MMLVKRSRPQIGDVIEIPTPQGLAYSQFTHKHPSYGALLRVMPGLFDSRPERFNDLVLAVPQFSSFFPLGAACNRGILRVVANESISALNRAFPTFRAAVKGKDGEVGAWWLWDGDKEWLIGKLKPGMEALPPRGVINDTLLIERIICGWRHEDW
ncbi:MAG: hypothetical protein V4633_04650 [Pseudomonadota bacterium]